MSIAEKTLQALVDVTGSERVRRDPDMALFDRGFLDSLGTVSLIERLSAEFALEISPQDVDRENWATPARIVADIERRVGP